MRLLTLEPFKKLEIVGDTEFVSLLSTQMMKKVSINAFV